MSNISPLLANHFQNTRLLCTGISSLSSLNNYCPFSDFGFTSSSLSNGSSTRNACARAPPRFMPPQVIFLLIFPPISHSRCRREGEGNPVVIYLGWIIHMDRLSYESFPWQNLSGGMVLSFVIFNTIIWKRYEWSKIIRFGFNRESGKWIQITRFDFRKGETHQEKKGKVDLPWMMVETCKRIIMKKKKQEAKSQTRT